ncbi:uncharacterized protein LOC120336368 [Styela clava]
MSSIFDFLSSILRRRLKCLIDVSHYVLVLLLCGCGILVRFGVDHQEKMTPLRQEPDYFPSNLGDLTDSYPPWNTPIPNNNDGRWLHNLCCQLKEWFFWKFFFVVSLTARAVRWFFINRHYKKMSIAALFEIRAQATEISKTYKIRKRSYRILRSFVRIWCRSFRRYKKSRQTSRMRKSAKKYFRQASNRRHRINSKNRIIQRNRFLQIGDVNTQYGSQHLEKKADVSYNQANVANAQPGFSRTKDLPNEANISDNDNSEKIAEKTFNESPRISGVGNKSMHEPPFKSDESDNSSIGKLHVHVEIPRMMDSDKCYTDSPVCKSSFPVSFTASGSCGSNISGESPCDRTNYRNLNEQEQSQDTEFNESATSRQSDESKYSALCLSEISTGVSQSLSECDLPSMEWSDEDDDNSVNFNRYQDEEPRITSPGSHEKLKIIPEYLRRRKTSGNDYLNEVSSAGSHSSNGYRDCFPGRIESFGGQHNFYSSLKNCKQRIPSVCSGILFPSAGRKIERTRDGKHNPAPNSPIRKAIAIKIPSVPKKSDFEDESDTASSGVVSSTVTRFGELNENKDMENRCFSESCNKSYDNDKMIYPTGFVKPFTVTPTTTMALLKDNRIGGSSHTISTPNIDEMKISRRKKFKDYAEIYHPSSESVRENNKHSHTKVQNDTSDEIIGNREQDEFESKSHTVDETQDIEKGNGIISCEENIAFELKNDLESIHHKLKKMDQRQREEFISESETSIYWILEKLKQEKSRLDEMVFSKNSPKKESVPRKQKLKNPFRWIRSKVSSNLHKKDDDHSKILLLSSLKKVELRMELEENRLQKHRKLLSQIEEEERKRKSKARTEILNLKRCIVENTKRGMELRKLIINSKHNDESGIHCHDCMFKLHASIWKESIPVFENPILNEIDGFLPCCPTVMVINMKYENLELDNNDIEIDLKLDRVKKLQKEIQHGLFRKSYLQHGRFTINL